MAFKNYYKILGVKRTASSLEIKKRYKELAIKYHPDINSHPKANQLFQEIHEAYQNLSDLDKRLEYTEKMNKYINY